MKPRTFFSALIAVSLVLLLAGGGLFAWVLANNPLQLAQGSRLSRPEAARYISRQAPLTLSLLASPRELRDFARAATRGRNRREVDREWEQLQAGLLTPLGLDYSQDFQPWLGSELTVAITEADLDRDPGNGEQPGYLLALSTRDSLTAREFLQRFWQQRASRGTDLVFEQYKGVSLIHGEPSLSGRRRQPLATAVVGDRLLLIANDPRVLREAIANAQVADLNLEQDPDYRRALDSLRPGRIGLIWADLPQTARWLNRQGILTLPQAADPTVGFGRAAIALALESGGLQADLALLPTDGTTLPRAIASPRINTLRFAPADSRLVLAGQDLAGLWQEAGSLLPGYPLIQNSLQQAIASLQERWGIDLPADVFAWSRNDWLLIRDGDDWVFAVNRTAPEAAAGIAALDALAVARGYQPTDLTLENRHPVTAWTRLKAEGRRNQLQASLRGAHTREGDYELFATSLESLGRALEGGLGNRADFRRVREALPTRDQGLIFVDWRQEREGLTRRLPGLKLLTAPLEPLLRHLSALGLSGGTTADGLVRASLQLDLGA